MIRLLASLSCALVLAGCAVGQANFSCDGLPSGVTCMSATDVYKETHGDGPVRKAKDGSSQKEVVTRTVTLGGVAPPPDRPTPVRTDPEVLRVLVYPWEDEAGNLVVGGYVFSEVTPRKWSVGDVSAAGTRVLYSINDHNAAAIPVPTLRSSTPAAAPSAAGSSNSTESRAPSRTRRTAPSNRAAADSTNPTDREASER